MEAPASTVREKRVTPLTDRQKLWFEAFTDENNPSTFMNKTESARVAGYSDASYNGLTSAGYGVFKALKPHLSQWFDEVGLSEEELKSRLRVLLTAKETKFFTHLGEVVSTKEVEALEIQRKAIDMAIKVRGMYAADKLDLTGDLQVNVINYSSKKIAALPDLGDDPLFQ